MKVLICGKGGSGKSSVTAMTALAMRRRDYRVLVVDADESNLGLHRLLGMPSPETIMDGLGGKQGFLANTAALFPDNGSGADWLPGTPIDAVPGVRSDADDSLFLAAVGKIHHFGEGCACPMGKLFRRCFSSLAIGEKDLVIIDTAAGVEHFGRRLDAQADLILCVVDPSWEAFALAEKIGGLAAEAGVDLGFVLNRMDEAMAVAAEGRIGAEAVVTRIPMLQEVFAAGLAGTPLLVVPAAVEAICDRIQAAAPQR
ncbi:MAG: P-loop NTPase [Desulfobacterales bacterium]|nr:P-loop NTPase [Desulfobacterales bacterium]